MTLILKKMINIVFSLTYIIVYVLSNDFFRTFQI